MTDRVWVVLNGDGGAEFVATWPEACHEHVNEAISEGIDDAVEWVVRECLVQHPKPVVPEGHCSLCGEPMPEGEQMFKYHGYSGPCPKRVSSPQGDAP